MRLKVTYYSAIRLVVTFILLVLSFIVTLFDHPNNIISAIQVYTIFAIIVYCWIIFSAPSKVENKINLYRIFILLTVPFYFGGQILVLLGYEGRLEAERYSLLDGRLSLDSTVMAMQFIISALLCIHIGYLLTNPAYEERIATSKIARNEEIIRGINIVATILIVATIGPSVARLVYDIVSARAFGHLAAYNMRSEEDYMGIWFI